MNNNTLDPVILKEHEQLFIAINGDPFLVDMKWDGGWYNGSVYPVDQWEINIEDGWSYQSNIDGSAVDEVENARCWFDFKFCWRGVWEGRIYFKDDEYWSEELITISNLWAKIEAELKARIKSTDPTNTYFDE